tara:strand:- start:243 stop:434 length:192 start_codon:yes stop_codon:yes gene_type:complete
MKTFIIKEIVPATIYRTIYVEAESEEDAVGAYYDDPSKCTIEEKTEYNFDSAEILEVEEEPEA